MRQCSPVLTVSFGNGVRQGWPTPPSRRRATHLGVDCSSLLQRLPDSLSPLICRKLTLPLGASPQQVGAVPASSIQVRCSHWCPILLSAASAVQAGPIPAGAIWRVVHCYLGVRCQAEAGPAIAGACAVEAGAIEAGTAFLLICAGGSLHWEGTAVRALWG